MRTFKEEEPANANSASTLVRNTNKECFSLGCATHGVLCARCRVLIDPLLKPIYKAWAGGEPKHDECVAMFYDVGLGEDALDQGSTATTTRASMGGRHPRTEQGSKGKWTSN